MDYSRFLLHPEWWPPAIRSAAHFLGRKFMLLLWGFSITAHCLELLIALLWLLETKSRCLPPQCFMTNKIHQLLFSSLVYHLVYYPNSSFYKNSNEIINTASNQTARKRYCWQHNVTFLNYASFPDPYTCHCSCLWGSLDEASSSQPHFGMASE